MSFGGVDPYLTTIDFPICTAIDDVLGIGPTSALTTINFPVLATVAQLSISDNSAITTLAFPALTACSTGGAFLETNVNMVTLSLPELVTVAGDFLADGCTKLATVDVSKWLPQNGSNISFAGDALSVTSVNLILARARAATMTTGSIDLTGGTNAAPTGQGATDKAALITAGVSVTTN